MFVLKKEYRPAAQILLTSGTCPRCVLRFCGVVNQAPYGLAYKDLICDLHKFLAPDQGDEISSQDEINADGPPYKKFRHEHAEEGADIQSDSKASDYLIMDGVLDGVLACNNGHARTCNVCLGILQEFCEIDFVKKVFHKVQSAGHEFKSFVFSVSLPPQLSVREHAAWLLVKQEIGKQGMSLQKEDIVQVKEAYKWIIQPLFSNILGVPADTKSDFEVSVIFAHAETDGDCHFLASKCPECFKATKNKLSVFTRMAVVKALEKIKEEDFHKQFPCLPRPPDTSCDVLEIQCSHAAIFVAELTRMSVQDRESIQSHSESIRNNITLKRRYNKYSRNLPQTPWIIDGERKMESSVEELILEPLMEVFKADSFNFSSSGREDVDVRTLGKGRPFAVELVNPHKVQFTAQEIKDIQQTINSSTDKIKVRDLQVVTREALGHMKEGEEEKTKCYSALIWTETSIQNEDIAFLDNMKVFGIGDGQDCTTKYHWLSVQRLKLVIHRPALPTVMCKGDQFELKLDQKTPLRVLHRRPLAVRSRTIHTMRTEYIDDHHFRLFLKTQAGTYIKEFVHGDFGRTKPNMGFLLKTTADILELDVESVDVDWPPALED